MQQELIHHLLLDKVDWANLKCDVDKLDINKLKNVPSGLSSLKSKVDNLDVDELIPIPVKLSDVVKTDVIKKDLCNAKMENIEDKIPYITNLATNSSLNAKINEVKGEISSITNLVTTATFIYVENKISNVSNLVKENDYNTKINEIEKKIINHDHDKYITTSEVNKFTVEIFDLRLKRTNLGSKSNIANFVKKTDFDKKLKDVTLNKNELNELSKKVKAISTKGLTKDLIDQFSILNGAK